MLNTFKIAASQNLAGVRATNLQPNRQPYRLSLNGLKRAAAGLTDRGGNRLKTATSLRPYLQGFSLPSSSRSLQDATGRQDPDYYQLFDNRSKPSTFQGGSLLISCSLQNRSSHAISIVQLNRQGSRIAGSAVTVQPGQSFYYPQVLSRNTYYLKVTSTASGQNRYRLDLPIINS